MKRRYNHRSPAIDQAVFRALADGATFADAARAAGVSDRALGNWRRRDVVFDALCWRARSLGVAAEAARAAAAADAQLAA